MVDRDEANEAMPLLKVRLTQELIDRLDRYRRVMPTRPSRAQTIRFLLEHALNIVEQRSIPEDETRS